MTEIKIKKGLDINLEGAPAPDIVNALDTPTVTVYPKEFTGVKPRLDVKEGDTVKQGSVLFRDKKNEAFKFRSPAAGRVQSIVIGARRSLDAVVVETSEVSETETFKKYNIRECATLGRDDIIAHLLDTGYLALIKQRPFSQIADPHTAPKSIFVNGMNTAPFQVDPNVALAEEENTFQAGLSILTRLTKGKVHLCIGREASSVLTGAQGVDIHTFTGPHPAGNTSVHIHFIDPISPGDAVWTIKATDTVLLGKLFLEGILPATRIVAIGGTGVRPSARKHYRIRQGSPLQHILKDRIEPGEQRLISGDVLSGTQLSPEHSWPFYGAGINVIPEGRNRHFIGWMLPGLAKYSHSRLFLSSWFRRKARWPLNTNRNGSLRAMVMTGWYDQFMPMRIMTDFLVRAVLAHDTDEAIKLGILETDPEDFALCSFICPSKMDICGVIQKELEEIQAEGI